jgi:hypothetical protein
MLKRAAGYVRFMSRALTVCSEPGCANEVERGRCAECAKARRAARPRNDFYASDYWRKRSRAYRRRHPICEEPGCENPSQEVHHIDGDTSNNADSNTRAVCKHHHGLINLQPYVKRDTMKKAGGVTTTPRGPDAREPVVGGGLLDRMRSERRT